MGLDAVLDYGVIAAIVLVVNALNCGGIIYHSFPVQRTLQR